MVQQHSHAPDFHFARAMLDHPAASDGDSVENRECVKCVRVVRVHFDIFRHLLLFDKDAAANRVRALHVGWRLDRDHLQLRRFIHIQ